MPNNVSVENNFIGGLKTEFTGLNFPENACTQVDNCVFSLIGDVLRREGINFEEGYELQDAIDLSNGGDGTAISTFRWLNAGGDGESQILVLQVGATLYFFYTSAATSTAGISAQLIMPTASISQFLAAGSSNDPSTVECQYAAGNGYLFVFNPYCDPFYVTFTSPPVGPAITANLITIQTRDFAGVNPEPGNPAVNFRPPALSAEHNYNLQNQGWTNAASWSASSTTFNLIANNGQIGFGTGGEVTTPVSATFTVASGLTISNGTQVNISWSQGFVYQSPADGNYFNTAKGTATATVTSYSGTTLVLDIAGQTPGGYGGNFVGFSGGQTTSISSSSSNNTINTWFSAIGNYPSNADIWFLYKDSGTITGENGVPTFNPADTIDQVSLNLGQAPQGHFVLNEFTQDRTGASGITSPNSINLITTFARPKTGAFYSGRVWYSGVDGSQAETGDEPFYTWTERIYFSQVVTDTSDFGICYQTNDPTDENLNELLPTDGGAIYIQGSGSIYKLFPIQNGILVFAANGVWFITGGSSLGFTADDYTITKISAVKSISGTSVVDILGWPIFWNEEGIYHVTAGTGQDQTYRYGGFKVEPITVGTILSFYNDIPLDSKRFARGDYDPISYVVSWVYRSDQESGISNRYQFDSSLNLNIYNRAFYPYTFSQDNGCFVYGLNYIDYPSGDLEPQFKYLTNVMQSASDSAVLRHIFYRHTLIPGYTTGGPGNILTFSEENDDVNWIDFISADNKGVDYISSFTTGYKVHGQAFRKWVPIYVEMYSNDSIYPNSYNIQGIWDFATTNQGRMTNIQQITNPTAVTYASGLTQAPQTGYGFVYKRHKIRGHGMALQLAISSVQGEPFHIVGWSIPEQINEGA